VLQITQRLQILEVRFKLRIKDGRSLDDTPLSTDFTLWDSVRKDIPEDLAKSNTESVASLFSALSPKDVLDDFPFMKHILKDWSNLSDDVLACLTADKTLTGYFMKLAEVR
jgi:hypothetical protein